MMQTFHMWFGLGAQGALFAMAFMMLPGIKNMVRYSRWLLAFGLIALAFLPLIGGISLVYYLRGLFGDLSIPTVALLLAGIYGPLPAWQPARKRLLFLAGITGLCFYPMALGATSFDPYHWGYQPAWLIIGLALIVLFSWRTHPGVVWVLGCAVMAFNIGLMESGNLWDYLIDPALAVFALGGILLNAIKQTLNFKKAMRNSEHSEKTIY